MLFFFQEKPWERKAAVVREWDFGKNDKDKDKERPKREERILDKRRHRTPERSPEPGRQITSRNSNMQAYQSFSSSIHI